MGFRLGRNSREQWRNSRGAWRAAWLVPSVRGTPTMKLWSLDVRSGGPSQATLPEEMRASLEGALYRALIGLLCSPTAHDRKLIRLEKLRVV